MAASNFMDTKTTKELEEEMGLSESQKLALEAAGLTKAEIREIHSMRLAESIAKERERLDKLEAKVRKSLPETLAQLLDGGDEGEDAPVETYNYDDYKDLLPPEDAELPWKGRNDLIFTNADYWKECEKATKGDKALEFPDNLGEMTDEEFNQFYDKWSTTFDKKTEEILERRRMGYLKAQYDWIKGECKGKKPEDLAIIMAT